MFNGVVNHTKGIIVADDANRISNELALMQELAERKEEYANLEGIVLRLLGSLRHHLDKHLRDLQWLSSRRVPAESRLQELRNHVVTLQTILDDLENELREDLTHS